MVSSCVVTAAPFRRTFAPALVFVPLLGACELVTKTSDLEGGCPRHLPGPALVEVESASGPYCIDATEVTNAQYLAFYEARGGAGAQVKIEREGCGDVATLHPDDPGWFVAGSDDFPVGRVNWCQAVSYCSWAGKRLCGKIGGGALVEGSWADASVSQWVNACSRSGARAFAYGATFDANACWGPGQHASDYVARHAGCQGGFDGIFDMSGNLWEWTDTCGSPTSNPDFCRTMGGAYDSMLPDEFACGRDYRNWVRTAFASNLGFRCCRDL
jgi:formylglycine-generating enzyme required for sulfatase activity